MKRFLVDDYGQSKRDRAVRLAVNVLIVVCGLVVCFLIAAQASAVR